ncbi:MAG TPA: hypothetical protein VMC86_09905 [Gemmatimonadales bacterium]|nr:hypothetical protein [Gemmatimonadales bacterium]
MSDRGVWLWAWLGLSAGLSAQSTAPTYQRKADSLLALWSDARTFARVQLDLRAARAQGAATAVRSTAASRGLDPIQVGDLMILTNLPKALPFDAAARTAWSVLRRTYASSAPALAARPLHLRVWYPDRQSPALPGARMVLGTTSEDGLARMLVGMVGEPPPDSGLKAWLGGGVQAVMDTVASRRTAYVELVRAPSLAARHCLLGDLAACRSALHLDDDSALYLTAYDAGERRALVARVRAPNMLTPADRQLYGACVSSEADSACVAFLRSLAPAEIPRPLAERPLQELVTVALEAGGPAAYDRLTADPRAAMPARLAAAAGMPVDSLIARWRAALIAARPAPPAPPLGDGLLAVAWVGVLGLCASRSSRWRVT